MSGDSSSFTVSFMKWSALYSVYKLMRRLQQTGTNLVDPNWFNETQGKIILKGREIAVVRLSGADFSHLLSFKFTRVRPLNMVHALLRS